MQVGGRPHDVEREDGGSRSAAVADGDGANGRRRVGGGDAGDLTRGNIQVQTIGQGGVHSVGKSGIAIHGGDENGHVLTHGAHKVAVAVVVFQEGGWHGIGKCRDRK